MVRPGHVPVPAVHVRARLQEAAGVLGVLQRQADRARRLPATALHRRQAPPRRQGPVQGGRRFLTPPVRWRLRSLTSSRFVQAQVDEFEKRLTAVHTRGLENVESPEMDEENLKEGSSSEKTVAQTPMTSRGRARTKRGPCASILAFLFYLCKYTLCFIFFTTEQVGFLLFLKAFPPLFFLFFFAGQAKPSVSSRSDDFVTPQKSRKSKKAIIMTFSSEEEEEEDEEGEENCLAEILACFCCSGRPVGNVRKVQGL